MMHGKPECRPDTVVIGGGQAGLAVGYYLKQKGRDFVILDAGARVGDAWRDRWDSLRLFTPAVLSGLPGMPFPFPGGYFPTKDETADYLEEYAARFELPIFGYPVQHRGVVDVAPGLYFLGLPFQHTFFSETVGGVGEDARHVADHLADRARNASRARVS